MPELPEVETTRRGIAPHLEGRRVRAVTVRERRLRWPVTAGLERALAGARIRGIARRAKYLLLDAGAGTLLVHLGMSGSLRLVPAGTPAEKHDHVDVAMDTGIVLRLRDPRRFGAVLSITGDPLHHPLLANLGPEPLEDGFDGAWLHHRSRGRRLAVKNFLMSGNVVVGVGNIYASEALHHAGIHPSRPSGRVSLARYERLAGTVRQVLADALRAGGTTLRDYVHTDGTPGDFVHRLYVYGRAGEACEGCGTPIRQRVIGQRSSFFCVRCQR